MNTFRSQNDDSLVLKLCLGAVIFIGAAIFLACTVNGIWFIGAFIFLELMLCIPAYLIAPKIYDLLSDGRSAESETQSLFGRLSYAGFMPGVLIATWLCLAIVPILIIIFLLNR